MLVNGENVSKFIDEDLSSIQKIITESLKDNRSLEVKAVNEMMKIQLESLLESIRKTKQSTSLARSTSFATDVCIAPIIFALHILH
jgi:hypothetical protein